MSSVTFTTPSSLRSYNIEHLKQSKNPAPLGFSVSWIYNIMNSAIFSTPSSLKSYNIDIEHLKQSKKPRPLRFQCQLDIQHYEQCDFFYPLFLKFL